MAVVCVELGALSGSHWAHRLLYYERNVDLCITPAHWRHSSSEALQCLMRRKKPVDGVVAHFAGHETFPLRQMWLKKAVDQAVEGVVPRSAFANEDAIAQL